MPKLLQIDSCLGILSTGKISEGIAQAAMQQGWDCYIAHGARYVGETCQKSYQIGSKATEYLHFIKSFLFDSHGLGSIYATKQLVSWIKDLRPDVIQLHCIHGYYLNYEILFKYLNTTNIPIVWTFHDCWAITGHCSHFDAIGCKKWRTECNDCPLIKDYPRSILHNTKKSFLRKKKLFTENKNLHIVSVSKWMDAIIKGSFLEENRSIVIRNGVDLNVFSPCIQKPENPDKITILGVASTWTNRKGLSDFLLLRERLPVDSYEIVLVGLSNKQLKRLPHTIKGVPITHSQIELATYYKSSDIFVNLTYSDTAPVVNIEALACGIPVITYNSGGSIEAVDDATGIVVEKGDINGIVLAIHKIENAFNDAYSTKKCRSRAEVFFNKEESYMSYILFYNELISGNRSI